MAGPLEKIRVLDMSRVLAGPLASQILADLGADVIKIERPGSGDETRTYPPFSNCDNASTAYSSYFASVNRGKRSVTIDFARPQGQELVRELVDKSDVLVENYKVGSLSKLGLGYADLALRNPLLVYCSITGFGQTGPYRHKAGYDLVIQGMGGLMSITGESDGQPMKAGVAIADTSTGLYATIAILAALYERKGSNRGQHIDLALFDVQAAGLLNHASSYLMTNDVPKRHGNAHVSVVPYQVFPTSSGAIVLAVANDSLFRKFAEVLGMPHLASDARYRTNVDRVRNREELIPLIEKRLAEATTSEWLEKLDVAQIPAGPINSVDTVFADPQILERNMLAEVPSPNGKIRVAGSPLKFSRSTLSTSLPPPLLGADTVDIISNYLGKSSAEIARLRQDGIIQCSV
jgi:crotonobetainyl-CoA:carnitine CoA-transferase CaiB-like acyl-CoA transferase